MIDEQLQQQASLHVLGALEPEEARAFEPQLAAMTKLRWRTPCRRILRRGSWPTSARQRRCRRNQ